MIDDLPILRVFTIGPWIALVIVLMITIGPISRFIWRTLSFFVPSLYPDLNGIWEGEITLENQVKLPARAAIRQSLLQVQIDLHTESAKSLTLETTPAIESGQFKLYYTYLSRPKNPNWPPYTGSTIFDVRLPNKDPARPLELSGYYFTDRKTHGRVRLQQVDKKISADMSYY
ncbi:Cap15 family cyclic dinucleotide receptor domain-containing protein [Belnapia rosea]